MDGLELSGSEMGAESRERRLQVEVGLSWTGGIYIGECDELIIVGVWLSLSLSLVGYGGVAYESEF